MPRVKSSPRKCVKSKSGQSKTWIVMAPEVAMKPSEDSTPDIVKLRHPRTGQSAMFLFSADNSLVQEIMAFQEKKGSWFVDDSVQEDGKMHISTPMDPLFLILPYLKKSHQEGRVLPLEDLLVDAEFPESHRLVKCSAVKFISSIADRKGSEDLNAWMYNEEKALKWLKKKVEKVSAALKEQGISVDGSAISNSYVMPEKLKGAGSTAILSYACGLVSEYLPDDVTSSLRKYLDLPDEDTLKRKAPVDKTAGKRPKLDQTDAKPGVLDLTQAKKPSSKVPSAKEKNQQRAAAGSKQITSFFKKK